MSDLEVLVLPLVRVRGLLQPHLVLGDRVKVDNLFALPDLPSNDSVTDLPYNREMHHLHGRQA